MEIVRVIFKEIFGLFVDDGSLAYAILALVAALALLMHFGLAPVLAGPILFVGLAAILVENVLRTLRGKGL